MSCSTAESDTCSNPLRQYIDDTQQFLKDREYEYETGTLCLETWAALLDQGDQTLSTILEKLKIHPSKNVDDWEERLNQRTVRLKSVQKSVLQLNQTIGDLQKKLTFLEENVKKGNNNMRSSNNNIRSNNNSYGNNNSIYTIRNNSIITKTTQSSYRENDHPSFRSRVFFSIQNQGVQINEAFMNQAIAANPNSVGNALAHYLNLYFNYSL
eukprot:TRINITY_DN15710_c0_g1_i1.p1 TRINITY_DN15710_c0_g1~~TRINITY_DN15710_c0_g1_i1.p1  ORF type:complete len:211 (-),score=32.00 TRINITY_DN15710_c0_g1_i1:25-657(-)